MAIDIETNWKDKEKEITTFCNENVDRYFGSSCYSTIKKNCLGIRKSRDLEFSNTPLMEISIGIPWVLPVILIRRAIISQAFRPDYLFYVKPEGSTPYENAKRMEEILNVNINATRFRETTLAKTIDSLASYGNAVIFSEINSSTKKVPRTVADANGMIMRTDLQKVKTNAVNKYVHVLDYGQDPDVAQPEDSSYQFFIDRQYFYKLWVHYLNHKEQYDEKAMEWLAEMAKKTNLTNQYYHNNIGLNAHTQQQQPSGLVDLVRMYSTLPVSGNENDDNDYEITMASNRILSITKNNNEEEKRMLTVISYYPREDSWAGINEAMIIRNHENIANVILAIKANNAIQSMDSKIFYPENIGIDSKMIESGKYIPYTQRQNEDIRKLLFQFQPVDQSVPVTDSFMGDLRENVQELSPKPDFTRTPKAGGMGNQAAAAINMVSSMQNTKESDILERISFGIKNIGVCNYLLLQQYLENTFQYRPAQATEPIEIFKDQILGDMNVEVATALTENKLIRLQNLQNNLTFFLNAMSSGHPDLQKVPLMPIIKEIIHYTDIGGEKEMLDVLNQQMQQPFRTEPAVPGVPAQPGQGLPAPTGEQGV